MQIIGIDPGKMCGYCIGEVGGSIRDVCSTDFWGCYEKVLEYGLDQVEILIEISETSHIWQGKGSNYRSFGKIGQGVGGVRREGELLKEGLERLGYVVQAVKPQGKVGGEYFKRITGWKGRTNQHSRDAGMLVFGAL